LIRGEGEVFRGAVRMARGKPWTDAENGLLLEMAERGLNPQQIYDSGELPGRTLHSIVKQFYGSSIVKVKPSAKVITIEPALLAFAKQHQLTSDACPYFLKKKRWSGI